ncbi:MAG: hypothetical protein GY855_13135 [candidate division Zixibacteria bacterium]|nr:hypothetical protein [candidate division Zixibacteria bacterium]
MIKARILFSIIFILLTAWQYGNSARHGYSEGDWVSFCPARTVNSIAIDDRNIYFATGEAGILRLDRFSENFLDPLTISDGLPTNNIRRIAYDRPKDELWIDTNVGTGTYEPTFRDFSSGGTFPSELELPNSKFNIVNLFVEFGYTYFPRYILDPHARKYHMSRVVVDDRYRAWMGFNGIGPAVVNTRSSDLMFLRSGPLTTDQRTIVYDDDYLYSGGYPDPGERSGISTLRLSLMEWKYYESPYTHGLGGSKINCADANNDVAWFGTTTGLIRFETDSEDFITYTTFSGLPSDYISAVAIDGNNLWVGTDNGLELIKFSYRKSDSLTTGLLSRKQSFFGQFIYDIEVGDIYIYVGNQDGIFYRTREGEFWNHYSAGTIGGRRDITAILATKKGLWLGHTGEITFFNPKNEKIQTFTPPGLDEANINDLIAYKGIIFAATDNGLAGIKPATGENILFSDIDGLVHQQVYALEINREYLWCATRGGITRIYIPALRIY